MRLKPFENIATIKSCMPLRFSFHYYREISWFCHWIFLKVHNSLTPHSPPQKHSITMSPMDLDKLAPKWLTMVLDDDSDHYTMKVNEEISSQYLHGLGYRPLNFVTIFGQARKGKSFLMNLLANEQQLFKVRKVTDMEFGAHFLLQGDIVVKPCCGVRYLNVKGSQTSGIDRWVVHSNVLTTRSFLAFE